MVSEQTTEAELIMPSELDEDMFLTTVDNPFNPHTEYAQWSTWDVENGYSTEQYLARVADIPVDVDLGDDLIINTLTNQAVQQILEHDMLGVYMLVRA